MSTYPVAMIALVLAVTAACAPALSGRAPIAGTSISQDELDIYETVLTSWFDKEQWRQLVNKRLSAAPSQDDPEVKECVTGLDFSAAKSADQETKSLVGVHFR